MRALALLALLAPVLTLADPLPPAPAGERHLSLLPGQVLTLECPVDPCPTITTPADPVDPRFGGLYVSPALARWDLDRLARLEAERDAAIDVAASRPTLGWKPFAITFGVGVGMGGVAVAAVVSGKTGIKVAAGAGSAILGAIIVILSR